ncbi:MAG: Fur family transcriptional regulator [Anaerolineales bacterium]|jgi:Fur family ferric uptake transcriptional regulator
MSCGKRLAEALRARGYRVTAQRTIILETIAHMGGHLSAQQVYQEAQRRLPGLNLTTVYRTVESLQQAGMIDTFSTSLEPLQFALRDGTHPHAHLVCRSCGAIGELDAQQLVPLQNLVQREADFEIDIHHLTLEGLCAKCREEQAKTE